MPHLPPAAGVTPTFTLKRLSLTIQRLYLALFPPYHAFLLGLARLALWKDYQRSLRYCIVSFDLKATLLCFSRISRCFGFCGSMIYFFLLSYSGLCLVFSDVVYRLTLPSKNYRNDAKRLRERSSLGRQFDSAFPSQPSGLSRCGTFSSYTDRRRKVKRSPC